VLTDNFKRPPDFAPDWLTPNEQNTLTVRVSFDPAVARWVQESRPHGVVAEELRQDGLLVTLRVRQEREIVPWLLGWGRHVRVLEPESLRLLLLDEAEQMLRNYRAG
jgi:predicted DNA-binding transcriptional regulator YafY